MWLVQLFVAVACTGFAGCLLNETPQEPIDQAIAAIQEHKLTTVPIECLSLVEKRIAEKQVKVDYEVRELHNESCGGDSTVSPLLFVIRVDLLTGQIQTTADSVDGSFHDLPR